MNFFLLILQTLWFLLVNHYIGWILVPTDFYPKSRLTIWSIWNGVGSAALVLCGALLVKFNIPGQWVVLLPLILTVVKLLQSHLSHLIPNFCKKWFNPQVSNLNLDYDFTYNLKSSAIRYGIAILLPIIFIYYPFLVNFTSGIYSVSGGDHSIYLRVSEYFLDHGIGAEIPNIELLLPPYPNWNILTYIKSMQKETEALFAGTLTAMPYMALWPGYNEVSYMASLCLSLVSIVTASGALVGYLFQRGDRFIWAAMLTAGFSNLMLWSCARHSTPAFFALGISPTLVLLVLLGLRKGKFTFFSTSIMAAATIAVYSPMFSVFMLIPTLSLPSIMFQIKKYKNSLLTYSFNIVIQTTFIFFIIAVILSSQIDSILHILAIGLKFKGADFGLVGAHAFYTISGGTDFDLLFPTALASLQNITYSWGTISSIMIYSFLLISLFWGNKTYRFISISFISIVSYLAFRNLSLSTNQYAGIRLSEIVSAYLLPAAGLGLFSIYSKLIEKNMLFIRGLAVLMVVISMYIMIPIKKTFWDRVLQQVHHEHSDFVDVAAFKMAKDFDALVKQSPLNPIIYWFGNGPVGFASSEILFRKLRYFEAYNYDYESYIPSHSWWRNIRLDILDKKYVSNAIFAIPRSWRKEIIIDNCTFMSAPSYTYGNIDVYDTSNSNGVAVIGDAWNAPIPYSPEHPWGRYLLGRKGGVAVWSQSKKILKISFQVFADKKNSGQGVKVTFGEKVYEYKINDSVDFDVTIDVQPGMNVLLVQPTGNFTTEVWGLVERQRSDQLTFTKITVSCP